MTDGFVKDCRICILFPKFVRVSWQKAQIACFEV